jgi:hypothetical protein
MTFEPVDEAMASPETMMSTAPGRPSRAARRAELLQSLTSEKRALFEEIVAFRKRMGPMHWDVVKVLREVREDG